MVLRQSFTTLTKAQRNGSEKTGKWLSIHWQFLILSRAVSIYLCKPRLFSYVVSKKENVLGYAGLVFPSSLGAVSDLANDVSLGALVKKFVANKSTNLLLCSTDHHDISFTYVRSYLEPICAIGYGVAGLCKAFNENDRWCFSGWNLTAVPNSRLQTPPWDRTHTIVIHQISNFEVARYPFFSKLPLIIEDYVKDHGGFYNCITSSPQPVVLTIFLSGSSVDEVHVIIDRILITGQNDESTALAVKNFIWLATQEGQGKEKSKWRNVEVPRPFVQYIFI